MMKGEEAAFGPLCSLWGCIEKGQSGAKRALIKEWTVMSGACIFDVEDRRETGEKERGV